MEQFLKSTGRTTYSTSNTTPSSQQEFSILDAFGEGIFITSVANDNDGASDHRIVYANKSLRRMMASPNQFEVGNPVEIAFPNQLARPLCDALDAIKVHKQGRSETLKGLRVNDNRLIDIVLLPHSQNKNEIQILGLVQNENSFPEAQKSLKNRALLAIDSASIIETTRRDLEKEILRLRSKLKILENTSHFDRASGLPNRQYFLERAAAEFRRSKRYQHPLSVVVVEIAGFHKMVDYQGNQSGDEMMSGLAQIWEASCRCGIDLAGRISQSQIALFLPETSLTGALLFVDRFKTLVEETPIQCDYEFIRMGIRTSTDSVHRDDNSFTQPLSRALEALAR